MVEAAWLDGASPMQVFLRVKVPMIAPVILFCVTYATITGLQMFETVRILTSGGPGDATISLVMYMYEQTFSAQDIGAGTSAALVLLVAIMIVTYIQIRVGRKVSRLMPPNLSRSLDPVTGRHLHDREADPCRRRGPLAKPAPDDRAPGWGVRDDPAIPMDGECVVPANRRSVSTAPKPSPRSLDFECLPRGFSNGSAFPADVLEQLRRGRGLDGGRSSHCQHGRLRLRPP